MQVTRMQARTTLVLALAVVLSCTEGSDADPPASTTSLGSTSAAPPATNTTSAAETQATTSESDDSTGDALDGSSSTGEVLHACGLADLKPGARDPIQAGRGRAEIPPDIASLLLANCGCHLADDLPRDVPDYPGTAAFDMTTWGGFQAIRRFDQLTFHAISAQYMENDYMPFTPYCNLGGGAPITAEDRTVLLQWLGEGAPDGATWVP